MSTSTLPKSVQLQSGSTEGATSPRNKIQQLKDFVQRYKHLPDDFLRIPASYYPETTEQQLQGHNILHAQHGRATIVRESAPLVDMIDISVVEAQLVKNYGLLRMDLYCKIRVGHMVCETQTCLNGAKTPKWDGVYQFSLKPGLDSFHLEIYDEKQFSLDEKIAWLSEPIPPEVFQGITVERWFPLSGRLGTGKEGSVLLVISHKRVPMRSSNFGRSPVPLSQGHPLTVYVPAANQSQVVGGSTIMQLDPQQIPAFTQPMPQQQTRQNAVRQPNSPLHHEAGDQPQQQQQEVNQQQPVSDDDVNQLSEMFPSLDKAIIRAVLENNHNDKEATIGALLALG